MYKTSLPVVALLGRTNVGKSAIFNRLSEQIKSITFDFHGVTRDFIRDTICWQDKCFELIDTGGLSFEKTQDPILLKVQEQAMHFLESADIILFVVDGANGLVTQDHAIARIIHKMKKKVLLLINKLDNRQMMIEKGYEFESLGFKHTLFISAQHGFGVGDLLESIVQELPEKGVLQDNEPLCKVTILGKPNVGKSSLMNCLLNQERSIVADMPGTTREAISEAIKFYQEDIVLIDTPGVRRPRAVQEDLEGLMVKSSLRSLDKSDIILLVIDAHEGRISDQELKLAFYTFQERYKALIILFNKEDKVDETIKKDLEFSLDEYTFFMKKLVSLSISCKTNKNITKILPLVDQVYKRYTQQFDDLELTRILKEALHAKPIYKSQALIEIKKAKQIAQGPITLLLTVNLPQLIDQAQISFFEAVLRKAYDLRSVPLKFIIKGLSNKS